MDPEETGELSWEDAIEAFCTAMENLIEVKLSVSEFKDVEPELVNILISHHPESLGASLRREMSRLGLLEDI